MVTAPKPARILYIFLHNRLAGQLTYNGLTYQFNYYDKYLSAKGALPLSLSLPLRQEIYRGRFGGKELPPYFYHLLPEGWLLNLAKSMKFAVDHPMDLLSLLVIDTIGAVRISKDKNVLAKKIGTAKTKEPLLLDPDPSTTSAFVKKHSLCLYCGRPLVSPGINDNYHPHCALTLFGSKKTPRFTIDRQKIREIALQQLGRGESLTGVQEKFSLKHRKDRKTIAAPFSCYVAKPQPSLPELAELANLEGAYMLFARALGLAVADSGIIYLADGTACFISRRFDINEDGSRIHQEDIAAPLGKYNKYESSHEGIARILNENLSLSKEEIHRDRANFLKMTLFNFLLGNTDAHLKNFALFHFLNKNKQAAYRLTPFYDIFPSLLFAPKDNDELGLSLNNKKNKFKKSDFESLGRLLKLGPRTIPAFISNFRKARELLINAMDAYGVSYENQYKVLELAKKRLQQVEEEK
jgi:serine/threonine-protein kinase HipA